MQKRYKVLSIVIIGLIIAGITIGVYPFIINLASSDVQTEYADIITNSGFRGVLILFGLELLQMFLALLPGEPIEILAGLSFGSLWGTIIIMISTLIVSSLIMILVRRFGKNFIYGFFNKKQIDKIENSKLFNNPTNIEMIIFLLFLIPGTPKDLLVYIAALLPIRPVRFIIISTIARFPSVISSTMAGKQLLAGNYTRIILIYLITFLIVGLFVFILKKLDKTGDSKDVIVKLKT